MYNLIPNVCGIMKKSVKFFVMAGIILVTLNLTACGQEEPKVEITSEGTAAETQEEASFDASAEGSQGAQEKEEKISFEEVTVLDDEYCLIKITGVDPEASLGYTFQVYVENKSADATYYVSNGQILVNGVQCRGGIYCEIGPGKKANEQLYLMDDVLKANGLETYTDILLSFEVEDTEAYERVTEAAVHIYPYGKEKAEVYVREPQPTDQVIVDNDKLAVTAIGYGKNEYGDFCIDIFVQNKTDKEIILCIEEESVNDYVVSP